MVPTGTVEVRPGLSPEIEEVLEALGGDEGRARSLAFEQRVRCHRRAVGEPVHPAGADRLGCRDDRLLLVPRRRDLRGHETAVVEQNGVRERASDVDAKDRHGPTLYGARRPGTRATGRAGSRGRGAGVRRAQG